MFTQFSNKTSVRFALLVRGRRKSIAFKGIISFVRAFLGVAYCFGEPHFLKVRLKGTQRPCIFVSMGPDFGSRLSRSESWLLYVPEG